MSRRGNCWDNAPQESLFGHMKDELRIGSPPMASNCLNVFNGIDYYNNDRYQWSLAKLSPCEYYRYVTTGNIRCQLRLMGALPPNPRSLPLLFPGKAKKKTKPKLRLPRKPDRPLGSLSSVALSCVSVKQDTLYHGFSYLLVTRTAEAHQVRLVMCPALGDGKDVVDFLDRNVASFLRHISQSGCLWT
jgi:hypothetical protein